MKENTVRRIIHRLATLCVLLAGLAYFAADRVEQTAYADTCNLCDQQFPVCNSQCDPNHPVPCYGECQAAYAGCLWDCGDEYSRTPIYDYNRTCWENAESVYQHCLVGQMPGYATGTPNYDEIYAYCMAANNNAVATCCDEVKTAWWNFNGPWCY